MHYPITEQLVELTPDIDWNAVLLYEWIAEDSVIKGHEAFEASLGEDWKAPDSVYMATARMILIERGSLDITDGLDYASALPETYVSYKNKYHRDFASMAIVSLKSIGDQFPSELCICYTDEGIYYQIGRPQYDKYDELTFEDFISPYIHFGYP